MTLAIEFCELQTAGVQSVTSIKYIKANEKIPIQFDSITNVWIEFENVDDVKKFEYAEFECSFMILEKIDHITLGFLREFEGVNTKSNESGILELPFFFSRMHNGLPLVYAKYNEFQFNIKLFDELQVVYKIGIKTITYSKKKREELMTQNEFHTHRHISTSDKDSHAYLTNEAKLIMFATHDLQEIKKVTINDCALIKYDLSGKVCKYVVPRSLNYYRVPEANVYMLPLNNARYMSPYINIHIPNTSLYICYKQEFTFTINNGVLSPLDNILDIYNY
jgi:hypothetical protein